MLASIITFMVLCNSQKINPTNTSTNTPIVKNLDPNFKADMTADAIKSIDALSLEILVRHTPLIVVGKVLDILEFSHSPDNSNSSMQRTIYRFKIEKTLKGKCDQIIKLNQIGGPLEWVEFNQRGRGFKVNNDPMYYIGQRYILFLTKIDPSPEEIEKGYRIGGDGSTVGRAGDLDDYKILFPIKGKILLKNGKCYPPLDSIRESEYKFRFGEQVIGSTEIHFLEKIQNLLDYPF